MLHHLILVREIDEQLSGSGCCGKLEGDLARDTDGCVFSDRRKRMVEVGAIYQAVRQRFRDQVEITIVDPRNQISLIPLIVRDAFRYGVRPRATLRALAGTSLSTGIFDGEVVFSGHVPPAEDVLRQLDERMALVEA